MAYIPKALRQKIAADADYRCGYCLTECGAGDENKTQEAV